MSSQWTKLTGRHSIRTGYDLRITRENERLDGHRAGFYQFREMFVTGAAMKRPLMIWWTAARTDGITVDRMCTGLSITYIPPSIVGKYCLDVLNGKNDADGQVYETYRDFYTVAQLEAKGFWERIAARVPTTTAFQCAPLQQ